MLWKLLVPEPVQAVPDVFCFALSIILLCKTEFSASQCLTPKTKNYVKGATGV